MEPKASATDTCAGLGKNGEFLSIMIPNYNNGHYVGDTLRSLLAVGPKISKAQIEVVDNCSTDDSEQVVQEVGRGRVTFTRQQENVGGLANHNACYDHAKRTWVQILHSDDIMLFSAYDEFDACLIDLQKEQKSKRIDVVFARCIYGDAEAVWQGVSPTLGPDKWGVLEYHPLMWGNPQVHFLSTIVRREAALALGGYNAEWVPVADWDFFWRLGRTQTAAYSNHCAGVYRASPTSHTSSLTQTAAIARTGLKHIFRLEQTVNEELSQIASYKPFDTSNLFDSFFDYIVSRCYYYLSDLAVFDAHFAVLQTFPFTKKRQAAINRLWLVRQKKRIGARRPSHV